jgi:hypothetical protein
MLVYYRPDLRRATGIVAPRRSQKPALRQQSYL